MRRLSAIFFIISIAAFLGGPLSYAQAAGIAKPPAGIAAGLWEGSITLKRIAQAGEASSESPGTLSSGVKLKLLDQGKGALMDIAEQSMFGYPLDDVSWNAAGIQFILDALGPGEELACEGIYSASKGTSGTGGAIIGTAKARSWKGTFLLHRVAGGQAPNETLVSIPIGEDLLPGTLLQPGGAQSRAPLVLLLSGAGTSDRDGNNYNVPGKSNTLSMLAAALYGKGVASFRYDKRGSGEAYLLERKGMTTSLAVHVSDAAEVLKYLLKLNLFSRIIVAGMNEGAWTGAAAINTLAAEGIIIDGIVVLDGSGVEPRRELEASIRELDEGTRKEAEAIVEALMAGKAFPTPSAQLSDFFSASRIEWLKSWLKFDPSSEIAKVQAPILFIYGSADLQVSREAFERLLKARPNAAARLIPSMNYLLKRVKTEEENYDSFTNPGYPLAEGLVDLITAFAKAKPLPPGSATLPYE
ncbi:MAG: alpha/beta hydrolase family protein [Spirochaetales bacterium]